AYEVAVHDAVDAAYDNPEARSVLDALVERVVDAGWSNALTAKLVALTMPGVPDVYQGSELWEQSLVDPDNRRWVDFKLRRHSLASIRGGARPVLTGGPGDHGLAKLLVTWAALTARRDRPELFTSYAGLHADGPAARHTLAFDRGGAITVATRLPLGLAATGGWGDTVLSLPDGAWVDLVSGREVTTDRPLLANLLATHPVALLVPHQELA
ncbi:MAG: malto-oligosyltrehalose synthase, partial [Actinomycetota bacterium]|nr:malto-oligosyltrehalose synthase [Actinomycetota bacterium]